MFGIGFGIGIATRIVPRLFHASFAVPWRRSAPWSPTAWLDKASIAA
jgi:hypothetical protein